MKLNYWRTLKVGLAFAVIQVFWTAYDYVVPLLLENTFGLSNSLRGLIMGADNLLSLFLLPLFGKLSDKTNTKWGRRTPFIVLGTIASVIIMIFVPITSNAQLDDALDLRTSIMATDAPGYTYTDHEGKVYDAEGIYTMLYNEGAHNSDYCDRDYFDSFGGGEDKVGSLEEYLQIALNPKDAEGNYTQEYNSYVKSGLNSYATDQVFQKITKGNLTPLILYMVVLLLVLIAMATFRSPAVALMPDVTPKPLRSQANAMINLAGGAGGAVAFLIYTITFMINPYGYMAIFIAVACAMLILLACYLVFVKEPVLFKECQDLCAEYGISNDDDDEEIYPEFAINNDMEYVVYGEIICDVLANCFMQNSNCEVSEMVEAINYYLEYDNYMDL